MDIDEDPRWKRLNDRDWVCSCCGARHGGLFALAAPAPDYWRGDRVGSANSEFDDRGDMLTDDICVIEGQAFFIRCSLNLPLVRARNGEIFSFGVWASLSQASFDAYIATFDEGPPEGQSPWFGWLSNRLAGYPDTINLKCSVQALPDHRRPTIELEPTDHPLAIEQRDGVTLDRVLDLYALCGHDMRDGLTD